MNILFLDGYFEPELTSFTHLEADIINGFIGAGHTITVVCPTPTRGVDEATYEKYKKIKEETLYGGKVIVKRFSAPREKSGTIPRFLRYIYCNFRQYAVAKKLKNIDAILCDSTPPTQGLVARRLKKKLRAPVVYNAQDIFPDSLVNAGLTSEGSLIFKLGNRVAKKSYAAADRIIVLGEGLKKTVAAKGVPEEKIEVIYNWADTDKISPVAREKNPLFDEFSVDRGKFVVVYAGNFGETQGADIVIDAAERLADDGDIFFAVFGGGAEFEDAKKKVAERGLKNLIINPLLPVERVPEVYSMGDVALITCKKGTGNSAVPSKTFSIMACDTPIIASFDKGSDLEGILCEANAGICVETGDAAALAAAIKSAKERKMTVNSRAFVLEKANCKVSVGKYVKLFATVAK